MDIDRNSLQIPGQEHLLAFWDELDGPKRQQLADDIKTLPLGEIDALLSVVRQSTARSQATENLQPPEVTHRSDVGGDTIELGRSLLAQCKVAPFTVAGGQGTRLGFDGPKGAFPISPVRDKTLFQLFAETIRATEIKYGCELTWYVMTSPINHEETTTYFEKSVYFGLDKSRVIFFQQGVMPSFSTDGKILLAEKHRIALSPDGHGGSLLALSRSGILDDMARRGIDYISYFQVDNPLVNCLDPAFIGLHVARKSEMSSKSVSKADDFEKVGNFVIANGALRVIEYSNIPDELATARNADGSRKYDAGSIAIHMIDRAFVERLTSDRSRFGLPWHRAVKKVPYVDANSGKLVEPAEPNAVKLESFIFDALPLAKNPIVMETDRAEEFSPVKNADGVDSVATAKRDISRRAARWLESAGCKVTRNEDGDPAAPCEISSLYALSPEDLKSKGNLPKSVGDRPVYLGDK